jgi:hypothetical protein
MIKTIYGKIGALVFYPERKDDIGESAIIFERRLGCISLDQEGQEIRIPDEPDTIKEFIKSVQKVLVMEVKP